MFYSKRFFKCLKCGKNEFQVEHILLKKDELKTGSAFGPWNCDYCGIAHRGDWVDKELKIYTEENYLYKNRRALLKFTGTMWLSLEHLDFSDKERTQDHLEFFYLEHQCPTNLLRYVDEVIIDGNEDLHGAFEFHGVYDGPKITEIPYEKESAADWLRRVAPEMIPEIYSTLRCN